MEKAVKKLHEAMLLNRKKCPWAKKQKIESHAEELIKEAVEFQEAVQKKDLENMKEEFGDVFWDLLFIGAIAEEENLFTIKGALEDACKKFERRKPWVFGNEKLEKQEKKPQNKHI